MAWSEKPHELRREMRVRSKASACLLSGALAIRGRVIDLARNHVCVRADLPFGLSGLIGELVYVDLRFDACPTKFSLIGRVNRMDSSAGMIEIEFEFMPEGFEDFVEDELVAAAVHDSLPRMILVDSRGRQRSTIADAFRRAGCEVAEASTPLEAIAYLGGSRFELNLIAVADTFPEKVAEELREFLLDEHPGAHMVSIGRSAMRRAPAASWLCSTSGLDDLQVRVDRVMTAHGSRRRSTLSAS